MDGKELLARLFDWAFGLEVSTTFICFTIVSGFIVLYVFYNIALICYCRIDQHKTVLSNIKAPNTGDKKPPKKNKKKPAAKMTVNCENAMIGDNNVILQGSTSPDLDENRNREPTRFMRRTISVWERQAKEFFVTNGMRNVLEFSKNKSSIIITGSQGSGKSTTLQYVSVSLKRDGFTVYTCLKPSEILYHWDGERKQVFVIDDPIGSECVSIIGVEMMERHTDFIRNCIAGEETKVILAIRSEILNDKYVTSSDTLVTSRQNEINLTDDENCLSEQERKDMLSHYLSRSSVQIDTSLNLPNLHCFPLLCHVLCKEETIRKTAKDFFSSPFHGLKKVFIRMREKNPAHFCALVMCIVLDNKLSSRDLGVESSNREKFDGVLDLLGLKRAEIQNKVINALHALDGVYLIKNGTSYAFLHSLFQDIVTFILGEGSPLFIFKYCSGTFLRSHVRITDTPVEKDERVIILEPSDYQNLAGRMCEELQKHNVEDLFDHSALKSRSFRKIFMKKCSENNTIEYANKNKIPLLSWSCRVEIFRLTRELLDKGADLNICDELKRSALLWVCRRSCRSEDECRSMVNILLERGADVGLVDKRNQTAIMYAVRKGDAQIVQNLLDHGACVKEIFPDQSPLTLAVKCSRKKKRTLAEPVTDTEEHPSSAIVRLLLEKGADPNFKADKDKTMFYQAVLSSNTAVSKCLLQNGADIGKSNTLNEDLLCCAITNCPSDFVNRLLQKDVDVNIPNHSLRTPLHLAVIENNIDLVTQLIKKGACINAKDSEGETPLHLSVKGNKYIVRDILLRKGADVNSEDKRGRTPLLWNLKTYSDPGIVAEL